MNVGEYGNTLRINANYDMSTNIALQVRITDPDGVSNSYTATLGTSPISTPEGDFAANEYVEYVFLSGDIGKSGTHTARVIYDKDANTRLISTKATFIVED